VKTKAELLPLLNAYAQRYGKYTMEADTMSMWWAKLKGEDFDQLKEVFYGLLGNHVKENEKPFGWKQVITALDVRFPPEDPQLALDREWPNNPNNIKMGEKQKEISVFMRGLISEIKKARREAETFAWVKPYAQKFVEVFGKGEAARVAAAISMGGCNITEERFTDAVRMEIR